MKDGRIPAGSDRPNNLLLVDDERQVCEGLRRVLYRDGYRIRVACGAGEAMGILAEHPVDVIVSDQRMPWKKGTEFLNEVRDLYPRTVRMILSGAADIEDVTRAMDSGAIYKFLTKPIDPRLLRANISEAFSRAASLQWGEQHGDSVTDPVTGLASREQLEAVFQNLVAQSRRGGRTACLLMLKVDQYDNVLSSFGYSFGRRFLRAVARALEEAFGSSHYIAHDAPGTFLLLTSARDPVDRIARIDDELDRLMAEPFVVEERSISATVSIGATAAGGDVGFDELVDQTYTAMKTGSERGGATMQIYQPQLVSLLRGKFELESDLRQAVQARSFLLHYQPQVELHSGRILGLEALLRWPHPVRGLVSPAEFIPLAEQLGLIAELGKWVLKTAVEQFASWRRAGVGFDELAINVSALQLKDPSFAGHVDCVLRSACLPARRLVLEVTESTAIDQEPSVVECLAALRALGVTLAVDDFGTGYANLVNLTRFAFKKLKIDRSLLPAPEDERGKRLYANIVGMARELGLDIVAEGVETPEELAFVSASGCSVVQGYFYSAPISPERMVALSFRAGRSPNVA